MNYLWLILIALSVILWIYLIRKNNFRRGADENSSPVEKRSGNSSRNPGFLLGLISVLCFVGYAFSSEIVFFWLGMGLAVASDLVRKLSQSKRASVPKSSGEREAKGNRSSDQSAIPVLDDVDYIRNSPQFSQFSLGPIPEDNSIEYFKDNSSWPLFVVVGGVLIVIFALILLIMASSNSLPATTF